MVKIVFRIFKKLKSIWIKRSSLSYISYLRNIGVSIGDNCVFRDVRTSRIDISRPSLLEIGNNVDMNRNFQALTHDWTGHVFIHLYNDFIPSHKKVKIGNNIYFGSDCIVLPGVEIGDNCIIGAGSVVARSIPRNSVAAGSPARVLCSIEDYYNKRKSCYIGEIKEYARSIEERFCRMPVVSDFHDDYPIFVNKKNWKQYSFDYRVFNQEQLRKWLEEHTSLFESFEDFMEKLNQE